MKRKFGGEYFRRVEEGLRQLKSFTESTDSIVRTLEKIEWDLRKKGEGYSIYGILDFRDLNRYLHPLLDFTAFRSPERYYPEQLALQYLFTRPPFNLVMIKEYALEYRLALEYAKQRVSEIEKKAKQNIKKEIDDAEGVVAKSTKEIKYRSKKRKAAAVSLMASDDIFDIIFENAREKILKQGEDELKRLYSEDVILDSKNIPSVGRNHLSPERNSEFEIYRTRMNDVRPRREKTNYTDARAFYVTQYLNRTFFGSKKIFLFISSAYKAREAFDSKWAIDNILDRGLLKAMGHVTTLRDPQYFLLRFLVESPTRNKKVFDLENILDLSRRYRSVASRLSKHFGKAISPFDIIDAKFVTDFEEALEIKDELLPTIGKIKSFLLNPSIPQSLAAAVNRRIDLKSIFEDENITTSKIRKRIDEVISDPGQLIKQAESSAKKMAKVINDVEVRMVPILFIQDKSDMIYRMTVSDSSNGFLVKKADAICQALCRETEDSFKEAFRHLAELRSKYPSTIDTLILTSKVYRAARAYNEALQYANMAYSKDENSLEVLFELAISYQKFSTLDSNFALLPESWKLCDRAFQLDKTNPRVLKVRAYLLWYGFIERWSPPSAFKKPNLLTNVINICERAQNFAKNNHAEDLLLNAALTNDLSYYYSLSKDIDLIKKGISLMKENLEFVEQYNLRSRGAYLDTLGCLYLEKFVLEGKENSQLLDDAFDLIHEGCLIDDANIVRKANLTRCLKLMREFKRKNSRNLLKGNNNVS